MKRVVDVTLASVALIIALPVMMIIGILVLLKLGYPIFFRQQRVGKNGRKFELIKFRTMSLVCDDECGSSDESRLSTFGRMLRSTSLDELPQLWNVIKGDMSLVGPRPLLVEYLEFYTPEQARRHGVRPGITGWAQVNGRNSLSWEERLAMDVWYVENRTMLLDFRILLITSLKVLKREGVTQEGQVTMERFTGTKQ